MTSNERKIIKCLWEAKGKTRVQTIAQSVGFSSDYTRLLCRSLERGGYLKFADANVCCLLAKGRNRFQDSNQAVKTTPHNLMVDAEIAAPSVSEKDEPPSEDKSQDVDLDNDEEKITDSKVKETALDNLRDASDGEKEKLASAGYKTVEDLAEAPISKLIQGIGISLKKAADWINQARRQTGAMYKKKVESKK